MRFAQPSILAFGLANIGAVAAQAQFLVSELSFGHTGRINDHGEASVPGFSVQGTPNTPEVLSNRIILTPPAPGNARAAVWANQPNQYRQWVADVDFRTNGPDRGGGNLNIWLAKGGSQDVGSSSIYTVGRFDGLALVINQHGGSGGMIRGFLNDGTIDYRTHHSVDSLAFAHCNYPYRNLGRPSQLKLRQTSTTFKVEIDGRLCFESDQITMPPGNQFGITAASADNPDSFELFKMVVMTEDIHAKADGQQASESYQQQRYQAQDQSQAKAQTSYGRSTSYNNNNQKAARSDNNNNNNNNNGGFDDDIADASPDTITSSKAQFADLHNRLQSVNHHLSTIFRQVANQGTQAEKRHEETSQLISELKQALFRLDRIDRLDHIVNEVTKLQHDLQAVKNDLNNKVSQSENNIKRSISTTHGSMLEHVATQATQAAPGHGKLIFVIIGSQFVLVAGYVYYERKKTLPKKYL
ncbi:concanavalin A-like lectin/glucanase [Xylariaceae sp. FL0594]|nr:concanavalin A-like lectin/glucanase [Xylariaceae sp. FL0594]